MQAKNKEILKMDCIMSIEALADAIRTSSGKEYFVYQHINTVIGLLVIGLKQKQENITTQDQLRMSKAWHEYSILDSKCKLEKIKLKLQKR